MYVNKCTKCGAEFETKNPKRVICPNCLYPDKKMSLDSSSDASENNNQSDSPSYERQGSYSSGGYSTDSYPRREYNQDRPRNNYSQGGYQRPQQGGYQRRPQQGGYQRPQQGYDRGYDRGGYDRPRQPRPYDRSEGGYQRPQQGGFQRSQGGFNRPRPQGGFNRRPQGPRPMQKKPAKQLLVNKEQLLQIEELYKKMLPLPNPDAHEVIGEQIGLEPRKVFFGINLVRQKMMLPKLAFPKRKLALSPDQLTAIKMLYEPLLPLPPIGCHKIISAQLKIDEWRVHVGIGLIRKQLGMDRWNPDRADAPEEFKVKPVVEAEVAEEKPAKKTRKTTKSSTKNEESVAEATSPSEDVEEKPVKTRKTRTTKKKVDESESENVVEDNE